ncbi:MAG: signal peptidase II [Patescibacteria group bacterium]
MSKVHREARIYFTVGLIFVFDQLLKWLAYSAIDSGIYIIPDVLRFNLYLNSGVFFALPLANSYTIIISSIILIAILLLIIRSDRADKEMAVWHYTLIFAGGFSNFIDRLRLGASIDYINILPGYLPVFNIGDIMIFIGVILLVQSWTRRNKKRNS